jgi:ABC-type multidrug transport system ATPase subunit
MAVPHMIAGLLSPDEGNVTVLGEPAGTTRTLPQIAFLAQDKPLYEGFSVADMMRFGAHEPSVGRRCWRGNWRRGHTGSRGRSR